MSRPEPDEETVERIVGAMFAGATEREIGRLCADTGWGWLAKEKSAALFRSRIIAADGNCVHVPLVGEDGVFRCPYCESVIERDLVPPYYLALAVRHRQEAGDETLAMELMLHMSDSLLGA